MSYGQGLSLFSGTTHAEEATGDLDVFYAGPAYISVEAVGIVIKTTMSTNAQILKLALDYSPNDNENPSGTANDRVDDVVTLTSVSGAVAGDVIFSTAPALPIKMAPGSHLTFEVDTAGGASTGDYWPFLVYRVDGYLDPKSPALAGGGTATGKAA